MKTRRKLSAALLSSELSFKTSRSSGPGGQNVNKVNTKVTLNVDIQNSNILTPEEKEILLLKLASKITTEGVLVLTAQEKRSQLQNKEVVIQKLDKLLTTAFAKKKVRRATKPSKTSVEKRIKEKKLHGDRKKWRQKPE